VLEEVLARTTAAAPSAGRDSPAGPRPEGLLVRGAELLAEMFSRPAGAGGGDGSLEARPGGGEGLDEDYVREEKAGLGRDLRALADDRTSWAHHRCVEEMCRGEPYALHALGRLPDLEGITGESLDAFRRELLARRSLSAYVVGPVDDRTVDFVSEALRPLAAGRRADDGAGSAAVPASVCHPLPSREREVREEADVEQARLVVGLATGTTLTDPAHPAQVLYNGLLGGFVHGRLFRRMREEAGLAYYVWSRVVALKGVIIISCGIKEEDYGRALDVIRQEVDSLARGRFSDREFEATRNSALAVARARLDSPSALVYGHLEHLAAGQVPDGIAPWRELEGVTAADVRDLARRAVVDTIYLLARGRRCPAGRAGPPEGGGSRARGPGRAAG
jgi:predicted Zn-dependent peptidase